MTIFSTLTKIKTGLILIVGFIITTNSTAQQVPAFALFENNLSYFNPANTGLNNKHFATLHHRNMGNNPVTFMGQYEKSFDSIRSGVGFTFIQDDIGFSRNRTGILQYRYSLNLGEESTLSIGLSAGINNISFDTTQSTEINTDPVFHESSFKESRFIANAGVVFKRKGLHIGLGVMKLNRANFEELNYQSAIHYVGTAIYEMQISENFKITPRAIVMTDAVKLSWLINAKFEHFNRFWYMAGYSNRGFLIGAGVQFWNLVHLGYAYEHNNNLPYNAFSPTHELFLSLRIPR